MIALLAAFLPALLALIEVWRSFDYYSHGFLVPVFAYAAYHPIAARLGPPRSEPSGLLAIAAALAVYALGLAAGSVTLQGLALVGAVAGLVLHRWGVQGLRRLAFPVGFLIFMVPAPPQLLQPLIVELQLLVSSLSVGVLHALGFAVRQEGNVLLLPGGDRLFVAEACSGITSLVTLLPLGVALAYFSETRWLPRLLIVLAVVPLALLANLLRVILTVRAAETYGPAAVIESPLHEMAGLLIFALACLGLLALGALLRASGRR